MNNETIIIDQVCVYSHWCEDELVYIGKGVPSRPYNFDTRSDLWKSFFKDKKAITVKIIKWFSSNEEAAKYEDELIHLKNPKCNILHTTKASKPRIRGGAKKNFSISMLPSEIKEIENYLQKALDETGFPISRNEFIRRAVLNHLDMVERNDEISKEYMEIFKKVGI